MKENNYRVSDAEDGARMRAILLLVAALAFALSPAASGSFGGFDPDRFTVPQVDPPVQPEGYAFAIWGVIYLWLIAGAGYGLIRRAGAADWDAPRWPLIASLAIGAAWIPVAIASPGWATVLIWAMLGGAIWALLTAPHRDMWWFTQGLSLYAGWLTAASCVSLGLMLAGSGLTGQVLAAGLSLLLAVILAVGVQAMRPDAPLYSVAVVWALVGVAVQNVGGSTLILALAAAGAVALVMLNLMIWKGKAA